MTPSTTERQLHVYVLKLYVISRAKTTRQKINFNYTRPAMEEVWNTIEDEWDEYALRNNVCCSGSTLDRLVHSRFIFGLGAADMCM